jgi:hypothetical protein
MSRARKRKTTRAARKRVAALTDRAHAQGCAYLGIPDGQAAKIKKAAAQKTGPGKSMGANDIRPPVRRRRRRRAEPRCRVCGCSQFNACVTGGVPCHWVLRDLCSACAIALPRRDLQGLVAAARAAIAEETRTARNSVVVPGRRPTRAAFERAWKADLPTHFTTVKALRTALDVVLGKTRPAVDSVTTPASDRAGGSGDFALRAARAAVRK